MWLEVFLTNIDQSHPGAKELLKQGGIAVARSLIPGALSAVDKTMEETFMKFSKSTGNGTKILYPTLMLDKRVLILPFPCLNIIEKVVTDT